jgi:hypothetical protein
MLFPATAPIGQTATLTEVLSESNEFWPETFNERENAVPLKAGPMAHTLKYPGGE